MIKKIANHVAFQSLTYIIPYSQIICIVKYGFRGCVPTKVTQLFMGTLKGLETAFPLDGNVSEYQLMHSRVTRIEMNDVCLEITVEV